MNIMNMAELIEQVAPPTLQESWDNSGFQILTDKEKDVSSILVCLEITGAVISEALDRKVELIVTHHPLFFHPRKNLISGNMPDDYGITLIKNDISVYSAHTSFDSVIGGNNDFIAERLNLINVEPIIPVGDEGSGMGRAGQLKKPVTYEDFLSDIYEFFGAYDNVRYTGDIDSEKLISKVGICTGAGFEFAQNSFDMGCDVYITGDMKYHEARFADEKGWRVVDGGHFGTEIWFAENFTEKLAGLLPDDIKISASIMDNNPFK